MKSKPIPPKTLDRVISKMGLGSRSEARSWIGASRVKVNGKVIQNPDYWVNPLSDKVELDNRPLEKKKFRYLLLNKPTGYITTYKDPEGRPTVYDLLTGVTDFLSTVGRLDLDTSGLLILTNDTQFGERLTNPDYHIPKTYLVKAATLLTDEQLDRLRKGVTLDDGPTRPAEVVRVRDAATKTFIEITVTEGRNRQVRRMLEAVDSFVLKLVRVKIGELGIDGLPLGKWRNLTPAEVQDLVAASRSTKGPKLRQKVAASTVEEPNAPEDDDDDTEESDSL
jgi:pseudouridine synthase